MGRGNVVFGSKYLCLGSKSAFSLPQMLNKSVRKPKFAMTESISIFKKNYVMQIVYLTVFTIKNKASMIFVGICLLLLYK
jgi:hypothetical protein